MIVADYLEVNLAEYQICAMVNFEPHKCYPIAKGKPSTPTPKGTFYVEAILNENELSHLYGSTLGTMLISLGINPRNNDYVLAIHGTDNPSSIGKSASLGCIRLYNADVEDLVNQYLFSKIIII